MKRLLASRLLWMLLGIFGFASLLNLAHGGLMRDPRFIAVPHFGGAAVPAWGDRALVDPVMARLEALGPISLLDRAFESQVRGALVDCPVVASVRAVHRHWPRRYSVEIIYRRPAVVLMEGGERVPFTWEGVRLPREPYARASRGLFVIEGVREPIPEPGASIRSEAFLDGVAALRQVAPYLPELRPLGIRLVDVAQPAAVVFRTRSGVPVIWGRPRARFGENSVEMKIAYLRSALDRLDVLEGWQIDVRYSQPFKRATPS
ncbi:MAG: hypothetical protein AAGD14_15785 [Planctomycetota bacterium]